MGGVRGDESIESLLRAGLTEEERGEMETFLAVLRAKRLDSLRDVVGLAPWELRDFMLIPEEKATHLIAKSWSACASPLTSAWHLSKGAFASQPKGLPAIATPLPALTRALGGTLRGAFVELAGPASAGKTQLCLQLAALTAANGLDVLWLDTEGNFSPRRIVELLVPHCKSAAAAMGLSEIEILEQALSMIQCVACSSLQELHDAVAGLVQLRRSGSAGTALPALLIIDSVASVARNEGHAFASPDQTIPRRQAALSALAGQIKVLVDSSGGLMEPLGVVVTNQVAGDPASGNSRVTLGHVWHHAVNWRLTLSHLPPGDFRGLGTKELAAAGRRYLQVEKSSCCPPISIHLAISAGGLVQLHVLGPPGWADEGPI